MELSHISDFTFHINGFLGDCHHYFSLECQNLIESVVLKFFNLELCTDFEQSAVYMLTQSRLLLLMCLNTTNFIIMQGIREFKYFLYALNEAKSKEENQFCSIKFSLSNGGFFADFRLHTIFGSYHN